MGAGAGSRGQLFLLLALMNGLWAPVNALVLVAKQDWSPVGIALSRWAILSTVLWLALASPWVRERTRAVWPEPGDAVQAFFLGAVFFAPAHILYYLALGRTTSVEGVVLQCTAPIFASLLAWLLLHERIDRATGIAIGLGTVGAYIVSAGFGLPQFRQASTVGNAMYLGGVLSESLAVVACTRIVRRSSGITTFAFQCLGGVTTFALAPLLLGPTLPLVVGPASPATYGVLAYLVVLPGLFCWGMWFVLAERTPISLLIVTTLMQPPLAALVGWALHGEVPSVRLLVGSALILGALGLVALHAARIQNPAAEHVPHGEAG